MNLYEEMSYKSILRNSLLKKKERFGPQFSFQNMANHCRIQKTYLSRALNDQKTQLSSDQLYLALEYLGLGEEERRYSFLLFEHERSQVPKRRAQLEHQIEKIRAKHRKTEGNISENVSVVSGAEVNEFYLDPYLQIVQTFMTIEKYQTNLEAVRTTLGLSRERFSQVIQKLLIMKLLTEEKGRYRVTRQAIHLSVDSPLLIPYRTLLRLRAIDQVQRNSREKSYSFSVLFSSTEEVRKSIQDKFFAFLKDVEQSVMPVKTPQEVYQLNFDLIPWSGN